MTNCWPPSPVFISFSIWWNTLNMDSALFPFNKPFQSSCTMSWTIACILNLILSTKCKCTYEVMELGYVTQNSRAHDVYLKRLSVHYALVKAAAKMLWTGAITSSNMSYLTNDTVTLSFGCVSCQIIKTKLLCQSCLFFFFLVPVVSTRCHSTCFRWTSVWWCHRTVCASLGWTHKLFQIFTSLTSLICYHRSMNVVFFFCWMESSA